MSIQDPNLQQKAQYWGKRRDLQAKIRQMETSLAAADRALLEGQIPAARPLFLEAQEAERAAQQLADATNVSGPAGRVATAFSQASQEKLNAIIQDNLIDAAKIRMQFQAIAEIEQALTGREPAEAPALLRRALFEKSEQASRGEQFDRAQDYLDQILKLDPTNIQARIRLAEVLLARARYASSKAGDGNTALVSLGQATAAYERVKDTPEFAGRRGDFEKELAEEQDAAYFAAGKQAQKQGDWRRARHYFRLVPAASPHAPQAREQLTGITRTIVMWAVIGIAVLFGVLVLALRPVSPGSSSATTTAIAQGATAPAATAQAILATTAPSALPSKSPSPAASASAPTVETIPSATTVAPTAPPTPLSTSTVVVLPVRIARNGVALYRDPERTKANAIHGVNVDPGSDWYICDIHNDIDNVNHSYHISSEPCSNTVNKSVGWVNQKFVTVSVVLRARIARDGVEVYRDPERTKANTIQGLNLNPGSDWYICDIGNDIDNMNHSYHISSEPCSNTVSKPVGWVNQEFVTLNIETPTPAP